MPKIRVAMLILFAVFSMLVVTACGGDDGATQEQLDQARAEGAKEAKAQAKLDDLEAKVDRLDKQNKADARKAAKEARNQTNAEDTSGLGGSAGPTTACGDGISAGANTSCAFAMNVAGEYGSNPGASTISAYSPATGEEYVLSCSPYGNGTACFGGNDASIYLP